MRLSSRKAARGSLIPPSCTGNPGTSWAFFSQSSPNKRNGRSWPIGNPLIVWSRIGLKDNRVGFDDHLSAFTCGPGSPRTDILGHSQPSLRDWSRWKCIPRTDVLGYSQPSLRDCVIAEPVLFLRPCSGTDFGRRTVLTGVSLRLFRRFHCAGIQILERLILLIRWLRMRQRLSRQHLIPHGGVVKKYRLDHRGLLQISRR